MAEALKRPQDEPAGDDGDLLAETRPPGLGFKLFRRLIVYHTVLALALVGIAMAFPAFLTQLPIGGVTELMESVDVTVAENVAPRTEDSEVVTSFFEVTGELDRLGYARRLLIVLLGVWLLMLPVSWVQKGVYRSSTHDHSLDETILILPGVVASLVLVVQHSLALAFSLAGIIAGVQFRRALQDTFDALFILVAIGVGIAAGVEALEISAVLTVFFSYATLFVYFGGDGLESDYMARRKLLKRQRKEATSAAHAHPDDDVD